MTFRRLKVVYCKPINHEKETMSQTLDEQVKNYLNSDSLKLPGGADRLSLCQICGSLKPKGGIFTCKGEDVICPDCLKKNKGLAYLMCRKCNKFLGFYKPGMVKLEGGVIVRIDPGDTLHTEWCQFCNPDAGRWDIEEFRTLVMKALGNEPRS